MAVVVTLSACYGAGGSQIGPALAERLEVPFVDRAIPREVADRLAVPLAEAERRDGSPGSALGRMLRDLSPLGAVFGSPAPAELAGTDDFLAATEQVIREQAQTGAVILGRAAAIVLADHPSALHVRLSGPRERRIEQAMRIEGVDRRTAAERQARSDRARDVYVRHFYRCDPHDPAHYHLMIDATRVPLGTCVEAIAVAATETEAAAARA